MGERRNFVAWAMVTLGVLAGARPAAAQAVPAAGDAGGVYARIVDEYMQGKWDDLETDLSPKDKELSALTTAQKADVRYIREALSECRPPWWRQMKDNQEFNFRPTVWNRTLRASFDPDQKTNVNMSYVNGDPSLTLKWDVADMDSPQQAEHGFTKGELADLTVWTWIGTAASWALVPLQAQVNMSDAAKLQLQRYLEFNGNVVSIYYGTPRARRWGLWLSCAYYLNKYSNQPTVNSRKAIGAMFVDEVAFHRAKYPSIKLPEDVPAEKTEENLCIQLKNGIEKHPWTLAEDKSLREAVRAFAMLNQVNLVQTGVVRLPSGLPLALDPAADQTDQAARDEWLRRTLERPAK